MEEEKKNWCEEITQQVEKQLEEIANEKVNTNNVDYLYRLVDIHKDLANENYWKEKIKMYGNRYSRDFSGEYGRGSYSEGSYGRRGVKGTGRYSRYRGGRGSGRYRGEEAIDEMYMNYGEYNEANQSYNEGNYGAEGGMKESAEGIMENIYEIVEELKDTGSPEVMQVIKKYSKKISEM
jgi:hypothetical protein